MQHHGQVRVYLKTQQDAACATMTASPCPTALMLSSLRPLLEAHLPLLELGLGGIAGVGFYNEVSLAVKDQALRPSRVPRAAHAHTLQGLSALCENPAARAIGLAVRRYVM